MSVEEITFQKSGDPSPSQPATEIQVDRRRASAGSVYVRAIARYGDRTAVIAGDKEYSYREVGEQISRYIQFFKSIGLKRGQGVGVLSLNRPEPIFAMAACLLVGLRYTPLHPYGGIDDHVFVVRDAELSAVLIDPGAYPRQAERISSDVDGVQVFTFGPAEAGRDILSDLDAFAPLPLEAESDGSDIAMLLYTGGSTGRPKGVIMTHATWLNNMMQIALEREYPEVIRFLVTTPISHTAGGNIAPVFMKGGLLILVNGFSPQTFLENIERHHVTGAMLVPTALYTLLDYGNPENRDISSLKMVIYGGSSIAPARLNEAIDRFGPIFCQLYGQTEAGNVTYLSMADHLTKPSSCGYTMIGLTVKILDELGNEVPRGTVGEVCARGPNLMQSYWRRPDETENAIRHGWLRTGDLGTQDEDGYFYIVGRAKEMIVTGGFNVFPREVEGVLETHHDVQSCAVVGIPHPKWGEAVTAFVVLKAQASVTAEELIAFVRERKGPIQTPKSLWIIEEMPLTAVRKVDKSALARLHETKQVSA